MSFPPDTQDMHCAALSEGQETTTISKKKLHSMTDDYTKQINDHHEDLLEGPTKCSEVLCVFYSKK